MLKDDPANIVGRGLGDSSVKKVLSRVKLLKKLGWLKRMVRQGDQGWQKRQRSAGNGEGVGKYGRSLPCGWDRGGVRNCCAGLYLLLSPL